MLIGCLREQFLPGDVVTHPLRHDLKIDRVIGCVCQKDELRQRDALIGCVC